MNTKSPVNIATKRTAVNIGAATAVIGAVSYLYKKITGNDLPAIDLDELWPLFPIFGVVGGIFYRASRALVDRFPKIGTILFGSTKVPVVYSDTNPPADD